MSGGGMLLLASVLLFALAASVQSMFFPSSGWSSLVRTAGTLLPLAFFAEMWRSRDPYPDLKGPELHFFFGVMREIMEKTYIRAHMDWFLRFGPVYKMRTFRSSTWAVVITEPELVKEVTMRQFKTFHDRFPIFPARDLDPRGLLMSRGGYWEGVRSAVLPLFHSTQLASFADTMHRAAELLIHNLDTVARDAHSTNIAESLQAMTVNVIEASLFGASYLEKEGDSQKELQVALEAHIRDIGHIRTTRIIVSFLPWFAWIIFVVAEWLPWTLDFKMARNRRTITRKCQEIIRASRRAAASGSESGNFLSLLVRARTKDTGRPLTDVEVQCMVIEFLFAGSDTTSNTLAFAIYLISKHPEVEQKMLDEIRAFYSREQAGLGREESGTGGQQGVGDVEIQPSYEELSQFPYIEQVIQETMRIYPTAAILSREINKKCTVGDISLRKGDRIVVPVFSLHHNSAVFPDPDQFRPDRFAPGAAEKEGRHPYAYIPFGSGPRMCIGSRFAMQEAKLALVRLYHRYTFKLDESKMGTGPLELIAGLVVKPKHGIHVFVHPRHPITPQMESS